MFLHQSSQIMAMIRSGKMINIGGRPVIVPNPRKAAPTHDRGLAIKLALAFVAIYVIWGSTYLAIRYAVETIPPLVTVGVRQAVAGAIMMAWAWARGFRPTRQQWMAGFALGTFFFLIGHGSLFWAEQYVGSGLAALLIATEPMFILVLGWMMGQQKISRVSALGLAVGVAGVAMLMGAELSVKGSSLLGVLAVLLGSLAWSVGVVISPRLKLPSDALGRTALPTICGGAMLLIAAGFAGRVSTNALGKHFFEVVGGAGISDHLWVGGGVHFLYMAAATGSARFGGDTYLCESGRGGFVGMGSGARAAVDAGGGSDSGDSWSDRADPAGRENGRGQTRGRDPAGSHSKDGAGMRLNIAAK